MLSLFPPVFGGLYLIQPDYMEPLTHDSVGIMGLIVAAVLSVVGWFWLRQIVEIEV